jgi:hypothetical protein
MLHIDHLGTFYRQTPKKLGDYNQVHTKCRKDPNKIAESDQVLRPLLGYQRRRTSPATTLPPGNRATWRAWQVENQ